MDLRQLEYFVAVADRGTFQAAAAGLHVAQPGLWRRVKDLEHDLGTRVFERVGRRVRLTRDGTLLLNHARSVVAAADRMKQAADDLRSGREGTVTIACAGPHLRVFLAPVIGALRVQAAGIRVEIREYGGGPGPGRGIPEDLLDGLADLATGIANPDDQRLEGFPLYRLRLVAAVPEGHPWRSRRTVEVASLQGQSLITAQRGSYSRKRLEKACLQAGFAPSIAFDTPSPVSIVALGAAGLGVPILADDALAAAPGRAWPTLAQHGKPIVDTVSLVWRVGVPRSAAVQSFVDLARSIARSRSRTART
jgi:DNA-binding transcriptional LysR family regulator